MIWETRSLKDPALLAATAASVLAVVGTLKTKVASVTIHNTDTTERIVTLNRVKNDGGALGAVATANQVAQVAIKAGDTVIMNPGWVLTEENDALFAKADVADKVTICVDGQVAIE